ncbi:hypothetical protein [Veronia pacifica]|uniref:hypothetical protein n=1 Tax=Veronia pacifica TaxID=1080227 RepID=UPI001585DC53|nr:hypothetical protein [Veronia pacifica]
MAKWDKWLKDGNTEAKQKFNNKFNDYDDDFEGDKRHDKKSRRKHNRDKRSIFDDERDI